MEVPEAMSDTLVNLVGSGRAYFGQDAISQSLLHTLSLSSRAEGIHTTLNDPMAELYLLFLKEVLPRFTEFNLQFQVSNVICISIINYIRYDAGVSFCGTLVE